MIMNRKRVLSVRKVKNAKLSPTRRRGERKRSARRTEVVVRIVTQLLLRKIQQKTIILQVRRVARSVNQKRQRHLLAQPIQVMH